VQVPPVSLSGTICEAPFLTEKGLCWNKFIFFNRFKGNSVSKHYLCTL
jgi:hypothetical protein